MLWLEGRPTDELHCTHIITQFIHVPEQKQITGRNNGSSCVHPY